MPTKWWAIISISCLFQVGSNWVQLFSYTGTHTRHGEHQSHDSDQWRNPLAVMDGVYSILTNSSLHSLDWFISCSHCNNYLSKNISYHYDCCGFFLFTNFPFCFLLFRGSCVDFFCEQITCEHCYQQGPIYYSIRRSQRCNMFLSGFLAPWLS